MRKKYNTPLVEMIKLALENLAKNTNNNNVNTISYNYLLGQCIRQYILPGKNIHVTIDASTLWDNIVKGVSSLPNIRDYVYQDRVVSNNSISNVETYKGTSKSKVYINLNKGDKFKYNDIFIDEHTVPVSDIVKALKLLPNPTCSDIADILDKMHIVKMRRSENAKITRQSARIAPQDIINKSSQDIFDQIVNSNINYPNKFV